jgi:hypothetical protein
VQKTNYYWKINFKNLKGQKLNKKLQIITIECLENIGVAGD